MSCGISKAGFLEEEAPRLEDWLNKNQHGQMVWSIWKTILTSG